MGMFAHVPNPVCICGLLENEAPAKWSNWLTVTKGCAKVFEVFLRLHNKMHITMVGHKANTDN